MRAPFADAADHLQNEHGCPVAQQSPLLHLLQLHAAIHQWARDHDTAREMMRVVANDEDLPDAFRRKAQR